MIELPLKELLSTGLQLDKQMEVRHQRTFPGQKKKKNGTVIHDLVTCPGRLLQSVPHKTALEECSKATEGSCSQNAVWSGS